MKKLKFAVIGTGWWSTLQIPAWFEVGGVELVALYNRTTEKAKKTAEKYGNPKVYEDPEKMFQNEELDFVDIITEVPAHEKFVLMAAKYKVPVICQKPMSTSYESCLRMYDTCKEAGIPYFIHENFRWQTPYRNLKKLLDDDLIGEVTFVEISLENGGEAAFTEQPFLGQLPHFIFMDMGPHIFDTSRFLFGEPRVVYANALKTYDYIAGENLLHALLKYDDKIIALSVKEQITRYALVEGKKGMIQLNLDNSIDIKSPKETGKRTYKKPEFPSWADHVKDYISPFEVLNVIECNRSFYNALTKGTKPETDASDNLKSMKIVFAAIESCMNNKEVQL